MHLLVLLGLLQTEMTDFPTRFIYFNKWNPYPFIYLKPGKGTPFGRSLPVWAIVAGSAPRVCNEIYQNLNSENCTQTGVKHKTNPSKHLKDFINNTANSQKEKRIDKLEEHWNGL